MLCLVRTYFCFSIYPNDQGKCHVSHYLLVKYAVAKV